MGVNKFNLLTDHYYTLYANVIITLYYLTDLEFIDDNFHKINLPFIKDKQETVTPEFKRDIILIENLNEKLKKQNWINYVRKAEIDDCEIYINTSQEYMTL